MTPEELAKQREENRKKYPWIAEFVDQLRAAGFKSAKVIKIKDLPDGK